MKLKPWIPQRFYKKFINPININFLAKFGKRTYSQEGEDLLIEKYLGSNDKGFYIDIGAHHPYRFSNTYYYYKRGWSGVNIEPNTEFYKLFLKYRPRDFNINIGLSHKTQDLIYFEFEESALNTFSPEIADKLIANNNKLVQKKSIPTTTLPLALENLKLPTQIDFLNIDTEGMDLEILATNDWQHIRPKCILAELKVDNAQMAIESTLNIYLEQKNYKLVSKLYNTVLFKRMD